MQAEEVDPCRELNDISLHHPFVTLEEIGIVRCRMTSTIVEGQLDTHLVRYICYRRSSHVSHLYFPCQTEIGLYQEGQPQQRDGNEQQHNTANATPPAKTAMISMQLRPTKFTCLFLILKIPVSTSTTYAHSTRDKQTQSYKADDKKDQLRQTNLDRYRHGNLPASQAPFLARYCYVN